jgi:hypothetical protein
MIIRGYGRGGKARRDGLERVRAAGQPIPLAWWRASQSSDRFLYREIRAFYREDAHQVAVWSE